MGSVGALQLGLRLIFVNDLIKFIAIEVCFSDLEFLSDRLKRSNSKLGLKMMRKVVKMQKLVLIRGTKVNDERFS